MSDATARFALPLIAPGQAQKELFHNEALARVDALLHPLVEAVGLATPPEAPLAGQCWIVGDTPMGAWEGAARMLACWTEGGWRFTAASEGMTVWNRASNLPVRFHDGVWISGEIAASRLVVGGRQVVGIQQPAIAAPTGGTVIDTESRAAIAALIVALSSHGLLAS